ncbi:ABC transporter ATP-binding protein [Corynebacterium pacaense]|uniref:ABC transporter ATP-binding protein n=1 Tax=Corynebacterium pacaense TaxID=1816684 RepID=UPI0015C4B43E|nr:ABC transporter ATP-binding protein [Corynebacterium pacaense]
MTIALSARDVSVAYGGKRVLHGMSMRAVTGRITVLLGPNGAGKSTALRAILGLVPSTGEHSIGVPCGTLLDDGGLHPGLTARQQLHAAALAAGRVDEERMGDLLDTVGMSAESDRRIGGYSLGMRRRVALALALLTDPGLLILDEPANGLDPGGIRWLGKFLRQFVGGDRAVVIATHHLREAAAIADDVVIIDHGRTLFSGPLDDLAGDSDLETAYFALTDGAKS